VDDHLSGEARVERSAYDRRGFLARTAVGAAAVAGAGALGGVPGLDLASAFAAPVKGGTLNVGIGQVFEDINVITAIGYRWGQLMAYAMYDTLVKYDSTGKAIPLLATSWKTVDPKTTMVTIRKGVKFHSGKDLTVDDVVWSLNRIHDTKQPVSNNFLALPADIWGAATKVDDSTLKIVTKKPTRMVENWRFWFIMPADSDNTSLGVTPNGTGPFKYKNFVKGDRLELEGFSDYWNGDRPYLDNLTFKFLADETAQIANFLSNTINYLHDISVASLPQVEGKNDSKLIPSGLFFEWW
jgi:peptide/nickel transport system substrate-binding protein